jgi:hypothetical protein
MNYDQGICIFKNAEDFEFRELKAKCTKALSECGRMEQIALEQAKEDFEADLREYNNKSIFARWFTSARKPELKYYLMPTLLKLNGLPSRYRSNSSVSRTIKQVLLALDSQPNEIQLPCELVADIMFFNRSQ